MYVQLNEASIHTKKFQYVQYIPDTKLPVHDMLSTHRYHTIAIDI
jgi:hypothetical protein